MIRSLRWLPLVFLIALVASCSSSTSPDSGGGNGSKSPDTTKVPTANGKLFSIQVLYLGPVTVGKIFDSAVTFTNIGIDTIRILRHTLQSSVFKLLDSGSLRIAPGSRVILTYRFAPIDTSFWSATDTIVTNGTPANYTLVLKGQANPAEIPQTTAVPQAGTKFYYLIYQQDKSGMRVDGSELHDTNVIAETGLAILGRTHVARITQFEEGSDQSSDYFLDYDPNGDIGQWDQPVAITEGMTDGGWVRIPLSSPVGSPAAVTTLLDTVAGGVSIHVTKSYTPIAQESLTLPAGTFATTKFLYVNAVTRSVGYSERDSQYIWYAPKLGVFVRGVHRYPNTSRADDIIELTAIKP